MRSSSPQGRFDMNYEVGSVRSGISEDLQRPAGQSLVWYRYDAASTVTDAVYDVGAAAGGRRWTFPGLTIPTISAVIFQGQTVNSEGGWYNSDVLRVTMNVADVDRLLPGLRPNPDLYYTDRILYRGEIFYPTRLYLRGHVSGFYTILTLDANQVSPEELVNDPQFQSYAQ